MVNNIKVLMVDDHAITLEGYSNILNKFKPSDLDVFIEMAGSCEEAYKKIEGNAETSPYQVIFLDISLPPFEKMNLYNGEDMGIWIKKNYPAIKVIVLTMYNENYRLFNILKNLNPDGFLIKSDVTPQEFYRAFDTVINDKNYFSQSVMDLMRKHISNDFLLDELDRNILFYLSKGVKTKSLSEKVPLSLAAIEKRKRNMKEIFGVESGGDLLLIEKAKQFGFL